jgi:oxygen-independent coproporphyrinogen-3 oxidase
MASYATEIEAARSQIDKSLNRRQVNKIQHSFPSPRYWTERDIPVESVLQDRRKLMAAGRAGPINFYVGVPYCIKTEPAKCGYCLFPDEEFVGNAELEAAMYKEALAGSMLGAVYFGGGTSNLYRPPMYEKLMNLVRDLFPIIDPRVDLILEGIPQLFSRDKLKAIKDAGFNRISMGVQQLNHELNALSGRKQTPQHVFQTIEWARELGLAVNVDVIFGWPRQTVATMLQDLEQLVAAGVYDITHYELNVGGPTDFALNRYHELPSTLANLEMYQVSREFLLSHGYEQVTAYNWRKPGDPLGRNYEEGVTHRFDSMDTLGLGYAALTFFGDVSLNDPISWSFINWRKLSEYKKAIDEGRFPAECGFRHEAPDFRLSMLFRNLFALAVDRNTYRDAYGVDVHEEFRAVWDALAERGFIKVSGDKIELIGDGVFFTPMVQTVLAERRYRELRERVRGARFHTQLPMAIEGP